MGTRNLTKVIDSTGRTKVAQYGQWDGYPEYTGTRILDFISEHKVLEQIEKALRKVHFVSDEEANEFSKPYTNPEGWMDMDQASSFSTVYPNLTRDTGCDILKVLVYSVGYTLPLVDNSDFENDELFCEGVYTLNYQTREFTSAYGGKIVSFSFDSLPDKATYLGEFMKEEVAA